MIHASKNLVLAFVLLGSTPLVPAGSAEDARKAAARGSEAVFRPDQIDFFEKKIRPILVEHCYKCHSQRAEKLRGELLLDSRATVLTGGNNGPAVVPHNAAESLLLQAVSYAGEVAKMPPAGKLPESVIADLKRWVEMGVPWPQQPSQTAKRDNPGGRIDFEQGRAFWAFQPVQEMAPPVVSDPSWPRNKIDCFVLNQLDAQQMRPAPAADKRTLIRRLYFDLIGLPPTYAQVEAFVADEAPNAYDALVERLLASPHYGERWARYWLDLVRYGEDNLDEELPPRYAHRYRDWVIQAFNHDLPYDAFIRRQLAADFLGLPPQELAALGFLGLSPTYVKEGKFAKEIVATIVADEWEERIDLISRGLLGLTVACARCHDHKFDPITTADYYALAGVVASTQTVERPTVDLFAEDADYTAALTEDLRYHRQRYEARFKQREGLKRDKEPDVYRYDKEILESASEIQRITSLLPENHANIPRVNAVRDAASRVDAESYVIRELVSPEAKFWRKVEYDAGRARDVPIHIRGSVHQLGPVVPRRFLEVLSAGTPKPFRNGSGRLELADAILTDAQALAGRVIVNRIWGWHFGQPLVRTPSNFGKLGIPPTHPELLADLTARFIKNGWSLKKLHREIVLSATYQQASAFHSDYYAGDPDNLWLWRMNRRRLDLEAWRDATLQVAGHLKTNLGGPSANLDDLKMHRRALYGKVSRKQLAAVLRLFDFPEATRHAEQRNLTTTALQQLYYFNSPFMQAEAAAVVDAVGTQAPEEQQQTQAIFRQVLARDPTDPEVTLARQLLERGRELGHPDRWILLAQALLASNEFLFVD